MIDFDTLLRQAHEEGVEKFAAGVVTFDEDGRTLLMRRNPDDVLPGIWDYPGGGLEAGENPHTGALRELLEETGIRPETIAYARPLDFTNTRGRRVRQFVFATTVPTGTPVALSEHDKSGWFDLDDLPDTSDGFREVLGYFRQHRATPGWRPVGQYVQDIAVSTMYASFYVLDPDGNPLCLRSALHPDTWQFPGGDVDPGQSPLDAALREFHEELGLDLRVENPDLVDHPRLLALAHVEPTAHWPVAKTGHYFWGGTLTPEQMTRLRLSAEHTEWRSAPVRGWKEVMCDRDFKRLMVVDRARRSGITVYQERTTARQLDRHGADRDFEGIVVFVTTPDGRLLMNLRDDIDSIAWPGHWTPVGGWREGIETAFETAAREVTEETGVTVRDLRVVPGPRHEDVSHHTVVLHGTCEGDDSALVLGEGQANRFVPIGEIDKLAGPVPSYVSHYLQLIGG
ncbi:NUDIX domain-containing protein [Kitasatospora sp. NPDC058218]|uniref:NUDIX hydrolase n=1 Tax=Kitasatospora sp. NPDC058218 TaxID=3346385 RepID=UPI0036DCB619